MFLLFGAAALAAGHAARTRGWLRESASERIHFHTIVWVWSAVSVLSLWRIPLDPASLWLVAIVPLMVALPALATVPLARRLGANGAETGTLAACAGTGNLGFTLGGYICYCLLDPAGEALAYAVAVVSMQTVAAIVFLYPLAEHYSPGTRRGISLPRLMGESLWNARALPLYAALAGVGLRFADAPFPAWVDRLFVLDALFYAGALGGYGGIGLRLRVADSRAALRYHALMAGARFLLLPVLTAVLIAAAGVIGRPVPPLLADVLRIEALMPTAIMGVMIANLFALDARLASVVWLGNTIAFAIVPLPLILWLWG